MPDTDLKVRKRIYRMELGAYLLIVAVAAIGFISLEKQNDDIIAGQEAACESANDSRDGQRQIWTFFFTVTKASAVATDQPRVVIKFYDDYLKWVTEEVLADRDCSDLTKVYPEPGPPPSFKEALRRAQLQEGKNND